MYARLHKPKVREALEFFEREKQRRLELRQRLDMLQISPIAKERAINRSVRRYHSNLRLEVLTHYGGDPPRCACCGETQIRFLTIDHTHGGGTKHRKEIRNIYYWLIKNDFPADGYQVLCMNCNWGKRMNKGICPHKSLAV